MEDPRDPDVARLRREEISDEVGSLEGIRMWLPMTQRELGLASAYLGFVAFGMLLSFSDGFHDVLPGIIGSAALVGAVVCLVKWIRVRWGQR